MNGIKLSLYDTSAFPAYRGDITILASISQ